MFLNVRVGVPQVRAHLVDFGIDAELATSKIKGFSGGQKSRSVRSNVLPSIAEKICWLPDWSIDVACAKLQACTL